MSEADYKRLREDIKKHGLIEPIVLYQDQVLDGRHRQKVCKELNIEPDYDQYDGDDPAGYVLSKNLARRHLTVSQRAMVGAAMEPFFAKAAKKRQVEGGREGARITNERVRADRPEAAQHQRARDDAAKVVGVSPRVVQRAKRVLKEDPEAAQKVKDGKMSVEAADRKLRVKQPNEQRATSKTRAQRAKELQFQRAQANSKLLEVQVILNRLCRQIEDVDVVDLIDLDGIGNLALVSDLHDDLLMLAEWTDRGINKVQSRLDERTVLDKISKLENTNGRPPAEIAVARKLAKRLRRKLENRLAA
jgi:ParB-like chromosome segregation protein Spo0J